MPRQPVTGSVEERAAESWLDDAEKVAQRVAQDEGAPPSANKLGDTRAVAQWGQRDDFVDYDYARQRLATQGLSPEMVQGTAFWQSLDPAMQEQWMTLLGQPVQDQETADNLAKMLEYPFRYGLVTDWSDDEDERTRRAEHLQREWEKTWPDLDSPVTVGGQQGALRGTDRGRDGAPLPRVAEPAGAAPAGALDGTGLPPDAGQGGAL